MFRHYDIRGDGEVYLDDFVAGSIQVLQKHANDNEAINSIADEIFVTSSTVMDEYVEKMELGPEEDYPLEAMECTVPNILEDLDEEGVYVEYHRSHFSVLTYIFKNKLHKYVEEEKASSAANDETSNPLGVDDVIVKVNREKLQELLVSVLEGAILELQNFFRLSNRALHPCSCPRPVFMITANCCSIFLQTTMRLNIVLQMMP